MHTKTFILAGIALIGSGDFRSLYRGDRRSHQDACLQRCRFGADGWRDGSGKCADRLFGAASPNRGHGSGDPGQGNFSGRRSSPNPGPADCCAAGNDRNSRQERQDGSGRQGSGACKSSRQAGERSRMHGQRATGQGARRISVRLLTFTPGHHRAGIVRGSLITRLLPMPDALRDCTA
jgi:hypothetical protein